jgi:hypothetical protein
MKLGIVTVSLEAGDLLFRTLASVARLVPGYTNDHCKVIHCVVIPAAQRDALSLLCDLNEDLKKYMAMPHVCVVNDFGAGIYAAFNVGIELCRDEGCTNISFINSGDLLEFGFCSLLGLAASSPHVVFSGLVSVVRSDGVLSTVASGGCQSWNINHPASIYPVSFFARGYNQKMRISADLHKHFELRNQFAFCKTTICVAVFSLGGVSSSPGKYAALLKDEYIALRFRLLNRMFRECIHPFILSRIAGSLVRFLAHSVGS